MRGLLILQVSSFQTAAHNFRLKKITSIDFCYCIKQYQNKSTEVIRNFYKCSIGVQGFYGIKE
jgi:hypothetical protein